MREKKDNNMGSKIENSLSFFENENDMRDVVMTCLANQNTHLSESELKEFVLLCMENRLNPLKREVYAVKYKDKFNIIMNYNEYLKRADATGLLEYYNVVVESHDVGGREIPKKAIFIGKRKDLTKEIRVEYRFLEFSTGLSTGVTKPFFMIEKVAIANGMRRLFPNELGNMPYINEELGYYSKDNEEVVKENIEKEIDMKAVFKGAQNE